MTHNLTAKNGYLVGCYAHGIKQIERCMNEFADRYGFSGDDYKVFKFKLNETDAIKRIKYLTSYYGDLPNEV